MTLTNKAKDQTLSDCSSQHVSLYSKETDQENRFNTEVDENMSNINKASV